MSDCDRWIALSDRDALGEPIAPPDRAFLRAHAERCRGCGAEEGVWSALGAAAPLVEIDHAPGEEVAEGDRASQLRHRRRARGQRIVGAIAVAASVVLALATASWLRGRATPAPVPVAATTPATAPPAPAPAPPATTAPLGARLGFTSGEVVVNGQPPSLGTPLEDGAVVDARGGTACMLVGDGIRACVAQGARVRVVHAAAPERRLAVLAGKIVAELDPQPPGTSFTVETRDGAVTAIGTAFSVEVPAGDAPVVTRVLHGTVVVRPHEAPERRVGAHAQAKMTGEAASPLPEADEERERAVLVSAVATDDDAEHAAVARLESDPPGAMVHIDDRVAGRTPLAIVLDAGDHDLVVGAARETIHLAAGDRVERRFDLRATEHPSALLLERARDARAHGDLAGAAAAYRELFARYPASAEAQASEVAYGELELGALGDPAGARATFERYLARGGPLAQEAAYGRIRALRAQGLVADERAAIDTFLAAYPTGAAADALRLRRAALEGPR